MPPVRWMTPIGPQPRLGRELKRLRLSTGLSQDAIEDALNIDQSVLSTYERDARVPRGPVLRKLAEFCGRPTDELVKIARDDQDRREEWESMIEDGMEIEPIPGPSVAIPQEPELMEAIRALFLLESDELGHWAELIRLHLKEQAKPERPERDRDRFIKAYSARRREAMVDPQVVGMLDAAQLDQGAA